LKGRPLLELLKRIGGWPLLQHGVWKKDFNVIDVLANVEKETSYIDVLLNLQIIQDEINKSIHHLEVINKLKYFQMLI